MKKLVIVFAILTSTSLIVNAQQQTTPSKGTQTNTPIKDRMDERMNRLKTELKLTPEQETKMREMMEKRRAERMSEIQKMREEKKQDRQEMKSEMEKILTPEQMEKLKNMRKEGANGKDAH
jgi:Spy/CpxP family protein refolding chaperone